MAAALVLALALLAACAAPRGGQVTPSGTSAGGTGSTGTSSTTGPPTSPTSGPPTSPTSGPPTSTTPAQDPLAGWSTAEQVGLLIMVGVPVDGSDPSPAVTAISQHHVSTVFLQGRTTGGGAQVSAVLAPLAAAAGASTHGLSLLVATDQEGGKVQVLRGSGFSAIPSAVEQGELAPAALRADAAGWGRELAAAGVHLNLAPVAGVVPAGTAASNAPIGALDREYGSTAGAVGPAASAFARGMADAGVAAAVKHFPGLGRVTGNTDSSAGVTDAATGADSPQVEAFAQVIGAGVPAVMVSEAIYPRIDPGVPAVFSPAVVGLLRDRLGFTGAILTDDLSGAAQVQAWDPGTRAVLAVRAGCDMVLATKEPAQAVPMARALLAEAQRDPGFAARVHDAAVHVLALRSAAG